MWSRRAEGQGECPECPPRASLQSTEPLKGDVCGTDSQAKWAAGTSGGRTRGLDPRKPRGTQGRAASSEELTEPRVPGRGSQDLCHWGPTAFPHEACPARPQGPRTRAAPHANLKASTYKLPGMESWAGSPQDMSPTGHPQILPRRAVGTIPLARPEAASPCCSHGVEKTLVPTLGCREHFSPRDVPAATYECQTIQQPPDHPTPGSRRQTVRHTPTRGT